MNQCKSRYVEKVKFGCYTSPKMGKGIDYSGWLYVVGDEHIIPRLKVEA